MFLKKIIDWMAYNENLMEEIKEYSTERRGELINENVKEVDSARTSDVEVETSVLDFCLTSEDNFTDIISSDNQDNSNGNSNKERFTTGNEAVSRRLEETEVEEVSCNSLENNDLSGKDFEAAKVVAIDDQDYDINAIVEDSSHHVRSDVISDGSSEGFSFSENGPDVRLTNPPSTKCCRNTFTQTEDQLNKRPPNSVIRHYKHSLDLNPGYEKEIKPFPVSLDRFYNVPFSSPTQTTSKDCREKDIYGKLFVFGCNGNAPEHLADKMTTTYTLLKRNKANGIKEAYSYVRSMDETACVNSSKHIISYPMSHSRCVMVAFERDPSTDMFQIGRCEESLVDFKVDDTNPSDNARHGVSRFACRILVHREGNHEARVYAAAFDPYKKIFIGENGVAFSYQGKMDGFTTNGVLIMHPGKKWREWRELSVSGYLYPLRSSQMDISKRPRLNEESNVLQDGTLIDLCGVTLLWRTPEGLKRIPSTGYLNRLQSTLQKSVPEYELFKQSSNLLVSKRIRATKKAYVFLSCGHVFGITVLKSPDDLHTLMCPVCRVIGPITEVKVGAEPGFFVDREFPSFAFKPCGHAASEKTIKYWSSIEIPTHRSIQGSHCPFCCTKLNNITKYAKLTVPALL